MSAAGALSACGAALLLGYALGCAVASTGSVYRGKCTHVGARVHGDAIEEWVGTVQVTTDWPACPP